MKSPASPSWPEGKVPVKSPSSGLPTMSVTPGGALGCRRHDDDCVVVRGQLGLGQAAVVERDRDWSWCCS